MKQEVERDRVRDVLVDREGDCLCPHSRKDPGRSLFSKLVQSDTKSISGMLTIYLGKPKIPFRWKAS